MAKETPSRMSIGYRILQENEGDAMLLSPVPFHQQDSPIILTEDPHSRRMSLSQSLLASPRLLQHAEDDRDHEMDAEGYLSLPYAYARRPVRINARNYINVISYLIHLISTSLVGLWGLNGIVPTQWETLEENETLLTPAQYCHWIWVPILAAEGVFAVAQLFPDFRGIPVIQDGTSYFFFQTCLFQVGLTLFWCFRIWIGSVICAALSLLSLLTLLAYQQASHMGGGRALRSRKEYWLFRFPFLLHCGWMLVLTMVHVSVVVLHHTSNKGTQLAVDVVALAVLLSIVVHKLSSTENLSVDVVIPFVILWSLIGIMIRLFHPSDDLVEAYGSVAVDAIRLASCILAGTTLVLLAPRLLILACHEFFTIQVVTTMLDDSFTE